MKVVHLAALVALSTACQLFSGLADLDVTNGGAAPASTSTSPASSTGSGPANGTTSSANTTSNVASGTGGGGPCGNYGEACCNGACNDPTLACTAEGRCGGCVEASIGVGCVRRTDGQVHCWGDNDYGQLGIANQQALLVPTRIPNVDGASARVNGSSFRAVSWFLVGGSVFATGDEDAGQLGNGLPLDETLSSATPIGLDNVRDIVGAYSVMCAILGTGELACAGENSAGEFLSDQYSDVFGTPVILPHGSDNLALSGYTRNLCSTKISGSAQCWGENAPLGILGNGDVTTSFSPQAVEVVIPPAAGGFKMITTGTSHHCALGMDSSVYCWGSNYWGELGQLTDDSPVALRVPGMPSVAQLSTGNEFNCVVSTAGEVWCWGRNDYGQLGHIDDTSTANLPAVVTLPRPATAITTAYRTACALLDDGSVWCWGGNISGELGIGTTGDGSSTPQRALVSCPP